MKMPTLETGFCVQRRSKLKHGSQKHIFSLVELVAVLLILSLITGLAAGRFGKIPVFASLDKTVREVERLFSQASYLATLRGKVICIYYIPESHSFSIKEEIGIRNENILGLDNERYLTEHYHNCILPEDIEISFERRPDWKDAYVFRCTPDGGVSGPKIYLSLSEQKWRLVPSPLTGILIKSEVSGGGTIK